MFILQIVLIINRFSSKISKKYYKNTQEHCVLNDKYHQKSLQQTILMTFIRKKK